MKKLVSAVLFLMGTAYGVEVKLHKAECTVFGNLKIKVLGLEQGRLGKKWLEADLPYFEDCDDTILLFLQSLGRGLNAASAETVVTNRQEQSGKPDQPKGLRCKIYQNHTVNVVFENYKQLKFTRSKEKLHLKLEGPCPKP